MHLKDTYISENLIIFPSPLASDDDGLLAYGGNLEPHVILSAYVQGIFPWFNEDSQVLWWSPNPRMVLLPDNFKTSKSLRKTINSNVFTIQIDYNFKETIEKCSAVNRKGQDGTWITTGMIEAYTLLHEMGYAHSVESYLNGTLVGGLYGLSIGKMFFGESMFHTETDASKVALHYLVETCKQLGIRCIDVQQSTSHLRSLGGTDMSRERFLDLLNELIQHPTLKGKWEAPFH